MSQSRYREARFLTERNVEGVNYIESMRRLLPPQFSPYDLDRLPSPLCQNSCRVAQVDS